MEDGQEIRLEFGMGGGVKGALSFKKERTSSQWRAEGELSGSVNLEILGKVHLEGRALWVSLAAGIYVKSASKDDIDEKVALTATLRASLKDEGVGIDGDLSFNGMTIYYAAYLETSIEKNQSGGDNTGRRDKKKHIQKAVTVEFSSDDRWDLIDPWQSERYRFDTIERLLS